MQNLYRIDISFRKARLETILYQIAMQCQEKMTINKEQKDHLLLPYVKIEKDSYSLIDEKGGTIDKAILDNIGSDIIILDKYFNIVVMNKSAEKTWGMKNSEVSGTSYFSLRFRTMENELQQNLKKVVKSKKVVNVKEFQLVSPDNMTRFLEMSYAPIFDKDRNIKGVVSVGKDITKRVNVESEFERVNDLLCSLRRELERKNEDIIHLKSELSKRYSFFNIIGKNHGMQKIYSLIERVAGTATTVLITGETGTGKELAARAIHYNSHRSNAKFIAVNCSALTESLLESELFGHVKGSFTGAIRDKKGKFELADGGTLFLDEIGDLSMPAQVKLLRALQEREVERVGDEKKISVNIRVIAATNQDLKELIAGNTFRKDLYYRLNVVNITLPPLSDRRDDIPLLVTHFMDIYNKQFKKNVQKISEFGLQKLMKYHWPGNIRELMGVIEKAVLLEDKTEIKDFDIDIDMTGATLPPPLTDDGQVASYQDMCDSLFTHEKNYLLTIFKKYKGKITQIAKVTGLSRRSVFNKMKKFNIDKADFK